MLCGHGSRNRRAVDEFAALAGALKQRLPGIPVEYGYLEFANPVIHYGLDRLRAEGTRHVLAVPGMLFAAGHAKNDIPSVLKTYEAAHPGVRITYGRELGVETAGGQHGVDVGFPPRQGVAGGEQEGEREGAGGQAFH